MIEFVLAFVILLLLVAGMAVGVATGRKPLAGTCGGLNNMANGGTCSLCGDDPAKCETPSTKPGFYDAS